VDHIPVHHTNEIAQTECAMDTKMANWWFHNEFMQIDGGKMSKSLGNIYTLDELAERSYSPMHFRYLTLQSNYRTVMNFTFNALLGAKTVYSNIIAKLIKHKHAPKTAVKPNTDELLNEFTDAINDDLNTPRALAVLNKAVKMPLSKDIYKLVTEKYDLVLSLGLSAAVDANETAARKKSKDSAIPSEITALAIKRMSAKNEKNFVSADKYRKQIEQKGFQIIDTKNGYEIKKNG
jgi:cysteinyl-tRNA synthetase